MQMKVKYVDGNPYVPLPLELVEEFEGYVYLHYHDNKDGTFEIVPSDD